MIRLFGYYALHSFINQIRKLLKTWVLIFFLLCVVIGGLIGGGIGALENAAEQQAQTEAVSEDEVEEEDEDVSSDVQGLQIPDDIHGRSGQTVLLELIASLIILALFLWQMISADQNGSKIFLPADVSLLFPSPMKPQSVLMFRILTQIGVFLFSGAALIGYIPTLTAFGFSIWAALSLLLTWFLALAVGNLLQVWLYTLTSTYPSLRKYLRIGIYALLAALLIIYLAVFRLRGESYLETADLVFNQRFLRLLPFWGWMKGFFMGAVEGNLLASLLYGVVLIIGMIVLAFGIWRIKADFYEDAMAKSEETAALLEAAKSVRKIGFVKRKKDRSEALRRDGMTHGSGANVFFFRTLYNRFRFAKFGVLTKTSGTYLVLALLVTQFWRFVLGQDGFMPMIFAMIVFVFFRTLGNPLEEDTSKDFFPMIPERTSKKLFWSSMGGSVNTVLDLIPAFLIAAVLLRPHPAALLTWLVFLLSVDFYGTSVSTFIALATPSSVGMQWKQAIQVMFLYFGSIPTIGIVASGLVFQHLSAAAVGAAALNLGIGLLFLILAAGVLEGSEQPVRRRTPLTEEERKTARSAFSRLGLGMAVMLILTSGLSVLLQQLLQNYLNTAWAIWVISFAPFYLVAIPIGYLVLRTVPVREKPVRASLTILQMLQSLFIALMMSYVGNLVGTVFTLLIGSIIGKPVTNQLMNYAVNGVLGWKILVMVILAPILEEFLFRRTLIDRMRCFGEKRAVILSAMMFGIAHGNFSQFFYAFALGLQFGYVYLKTGKLRYSIGLHMLINFLGSVLSLYLLEQSGLSDLSAISSAAQANQRYVLFFGLYVVGLIGSALIGLVLLILKYRSISFDRAGLELPKKGSLRIVLGNAGMILFFIFCILQMIASLFV